MTNRRKPGEGSVYQLPSGRWIARLTMATGERPSLGSFEDDVEANAALDAALAVLAEEGLAPVGGVTLRGWFPRFLDELELSKSYVAMPNARSIWRCHLSGAPFVDLPLRALTRYSIECWIKKLAAKPPEEISDSYLQSIVRILRKGLEAAREASFADENPAADVTIPRRPAAIEDPWTYLEPREQTSLISCERIPEAYRLMIRVGMRSGFRAGEQFCLHDQDVRLDADAPHFTVRFGSPWRAPKGRRVRRVDMLPDTVEALRRWYSIRDEWCRPDRNDRGRGGARLVFPGPMGGLLHSDKLEDWPTWLEWAGIRRHVRWHDLRHTCGASLVSGWWGRAWSLHEVKEYLGHKNIEETERYAHLSPDALQRAARETTTAPTVRQRDTKTQLNPAFGVDDGSASGPEELRHVSPEDWRLVGLARKLTETVHAGAFADDLRERLGLALRARGEAILAGGPHALDQALEVADLLIPNELAESAGKGARRA